MAAELWCMSCESEEATDVAWNCDGEGYVCPVRHLCHACLGANDHLRFSSPIADLSSRPFFPLTLQYRLALDKVRFINAVLRALGDEDEAGSGEDRAAWTALAARYLSAEILLSEDSRLPPLARHILPRVLRTPVAGHEALFRAVHQAAALTEGIQVQHIEHIVPRLIDALWDEKANGKDIESDGPTRERRRRRGSK